MVIVKIGGVPNVEHIILRNHLMMYTILNTAFGGVFTLSKNSMEKIHYQYTYYCTVCVTTIVIVMVQRNFS